MLRPDIIERYRYWILGLIILAAAALRLLNLEHIALRGDSLQFWNIPRMQGVSPSDLLFKWERFHTDHPPLPLFMTMWFIDLLGLEISFFTIRLPSALMGILCVPAMYWAGARAHSFSFGLLLASLIALAPFHIQLSMEAYYYSGLLFGATLLFCAFLDASAWGGDRNRTPGAVFYILLVVGMTFALHSQATGWPLAYMIAGAIGLIVVLLWRKGEVNIVHVYAVVGIVAVQSLVLFAVPWGPKYLLAKTGGASLEFGQQVVAMIGKTPLDMLWLVLTSFTFGGSSLRALFAFIVLAVAVYVLIRRRADRLRNGLILLMLVGTLAAFFISRQAVGALYESRYVAVLLPILLYILAIGLMPELDGRWRFWSYAAVPLGIGALIYPAILSASISGQPTPYLKVVRHLDNLMPPGTPILVDRWFEPWNELAAHPISNVVYTFTVPNEPVDQYRQLNWRQTAKDFFARNPDAGYLEVAKSYWEVPDIGVWTWPRQHFRRHVAFTNEAGLALRRMQLAARGDYYDPYTNRVVVEFFYNTRDDINEMLRADGVTFHVFYDSGWTYIKSGPFGFLELQTQQLVDWRMMQERSVLHVVNLTDMTRLVMLRIHGVALNGSKQMSANDRFRKNFTSGGMEVWELGPLEAAPGVTPVSLRDLRGMQSAARLLVERATVHPVEGEDR